MRSKSESRLDGVHASHTGGCHRQCREKEDGLRQRGQWDGGGRPRGDARARDGAKDKGKAAQGLVMSPCVLGATVRV